MKNLLELQAVQNVIQRKQAKRADSKTMAHVPPTFQTSSKDKQ
jgi:hypothetical protein